MTAETTTKQLFICTWCGFIYDPDEGDPDGGVPPGTSFDDIPDDWFCPVCGARKSDFEPYGGGRNRSWRARPPPEAALAIQRCFPPAPIEFTDAEPAECDQRAQWHQDGE